MLRDVCVRCVQVTMPHWEGCAAKCCRHDSRRLGVPSSKEGSKMFALEAKIEARFHLGSGDKGLLRLVARPRSQLSGFELCMHASCRRTRSIRDVSDILTDLIVLMHRVTFVALSILI